MNINHIENAKVFKAFCDETRLMVLELLQSGEKCACVLLEKVAVGQSTLSHHMKILVDSGVVYARKEGKWTYYSISTRGSEEAIRLLKQLTMISSNIYDNCDKRGDVNE
jgi:Predicted transcriptional regulators